AAATANVTPATLVLGGSFTASSKTYDASTVAQIDTDELGIASGLLDGDVVTILTSGATGAFADKHVGQGKAVTLAANGSGVLTGTDAGNYVLDTSGLAAVTANITARPITVTAQTDSRAYDGTTASSVAPQITAGSLADGDTWAAMSQQFDTRHAGTGKTLSAIGLVADGNGGANYAVTWVNATGTITPATLVLGGSFTVAATKDYDGTAIAELLTNGLTLDLLHADDEV